MQLTLGFFIARTLIPVLVPKHVGMLPEINSTSEAGQDIEINHGRGELNLERLI
jgi:hypothetical protein